MDNKAGKEGGSDRKPPGLLSQNSSRPSIIDGFRPITALFRSYSKHISIAVGLYLQMTRNQDRFDLLISIFRPVKRSRKRCLKIDIFVRISFWQAVCLARKQIFMMDQPFTARLLVRSRSSISILLYLYTTSILLYLYTTFYIYIQHRYLVKYLRSFYTIEV